jgi:hypothetical protein
VFSFFEKYVTKESKNDQTQVAHSKPIVELKKKIKDTTKKLVKGKRL